MKWLRRLCGLTLGGLLLSMAGTGAADDKLPEELTRPWIPKSFRMYLVADGRYELKDERNRVGRLHDPVTDYGLYTVIGAFVRDVPTEKDAAVAVLRKQQELVAKYQLRRVGAFMAFLALKKDYAQDDERDKLTLQINTLAKAAQAPLVSVGLAEATLGDAVPPQVTAWGIGEDDAITIVLYHRFRLVKRWSFKADAPPTEKDLQELADAVAKLVGK
jgi:hypothetical protein